MAKTPSPFSATMIGAHTDTSKEALVRKHFREEAQQVSNHLQGVHHTRKLAYMQVDYSDTVQKLGKSQEHVPLTLSTARPEVVSKPTSTNTSNDQIREREHMNSMKEALVHERFINERKRLYNREVGRVAIVNEVLKGTGAGHGPPVIDHIFPQKASHNQILAMTGTLKAPNPHIIPPEVPRSKKWHGDGIGWG